MAIVDQPRLKREYGPDFALKKIRGDCESVVENAAETLSR